MGYMRHHAIVVTGVELTKAVIDHPGIVAAWKEAKSIFSDTSAVVTELTSAKVNSIRSFLVAPDGSKEGWEDSVKGDAAREKFISYLNSIRLEDGSTLVDWVEVQFGDDNGETKLLRDSDSERRIFG